jgi:hypothetical protein
MRNQNITLALAASIALTLSATSSAATKICLVLPKAQLGQGTSGADVAEPVRATLTAYLGGPTTELVALTARIPIQIDAEAQTISCEYVLYSSVTQKKGGNLSKIFAAAAPLATMAGGMGSMGGNYGAMMAGQAVAQAATTAAAQSAQQEAMEALGGAAKSNINADRDQPGRCETLTTANTGKVVRPASMLRRLKVDRRMIFILVLERCATSRG